MGRRSGDVVTGLYWTTPLEGRIRNVLVCNLMRHYLGKDRTPTEWRSDESGQICHWAKPKVNVQTRAKKQPPVQMEETVIESKPFRFRDLTRHMEKIGGFDPSAFNLPPPICDWLDHTIHMKHGLVATSNSGNRNLHFQFPLKNFGANVPMIPRIDREGYISTSFQTELARSVSARRKRLVEGLTTIDSDQWFFELRTLVGEAISWVDITLNTTYLKAKHDCLPGWQFDEAALGSRITKLAEKFTWIRKICKRDIASPPQIRDSFDLLRRVRNHLQHFDPPCLCLTLEDASKWLNAVHDIAILQLYIRDALLAAASQPLIDLLFQKKVEFRSPNSKNPQPDYVGYKSTTWQSGVPPEDPGTEIIFETFPNRILYGAE